MFRFLSRLYFLQNLLGFVVNVLIPPVIIHNISKYFAIKKAFYLTGLEGVEGDYLEFGVFTGSSMACAIYGARSTKVKYAHKKIKFLGFDSFEGFGELTDQDKHLFYVDLNFKTDIESVRKRLLKIAKKNQSVELIPGFFNETCDNKFPKDYGVQGISVILVDSDTFSSAKSCLDFCVPALQNGTILIMDDFFSYRGNAKKGVAGAFYAWLDQNSHITTRKISDYGMGGVIYIIGFIESKDPGKQGSSFFKNS